MPDTITVERSREQEQDKEPHDGLWHIYPQTNPRPGDKALCGRPLRLGYGVRFSWGEPDDCVVCEYLADALDFDA